MTFLQSPLSIIWTPHSSQDRVKVEVHLHDGTMASKESVTFDVIDRERPPEDRIKDFSGLRSPSVKLKYLTLANLKHAPLSHQILECTRLLCDENALIAKAAFEHVSSLLSQHESWINVFLDECEPYLWELSDRPQILEKVRSLALILEDQEAFLKRCDQVIAYNKKRGLEY
jgi:hypothetical protein